MAPNIALHLILASHPVNFPSRTASSSALWVVLWGHVCVFLFRKLAGWLALDRRRYMVSLDLR
jgi:hypothetical protein